MPSSRGLPSFSRLPVGAVVGRNTVQGQAPVPAEETVTFTLTAALRLPESSKARL